MKSPFLLCVALAGCATTADPATDPSSGGGKADGAGVPYASIMTALRTQYVDGAVHGQAYQFDDASIGVEDGGEVSFAWVTADLHAAGGGEIDWANSDFATRVAEGAFDGPGLQSLLILTDDGWKVQNADVGPTDVWWDGIWYKLPVPCEMFYGGIGSALAVTVGCPIVTEPVPGTTTRHDLIKAIHHDLDPVVHGQHNELVVSWIRATDRYAFVTADVQKTGGGQLDWVNTDFAARFAQGPWRGPHLSAFVENTATGWTIRQMDVGATESSWDGVWAQFPDVACALFPVSSCSLE